MMPKAFSRPPGPAAWWRACAQKSRPWRKMQNAFAIVSLPSVATPSMTGPRPAPNGAYTTHGAEQRASTFLKKLMHWRQRSDAMPQLPDPYRHRGTRWRGHLEIVRMALTARRITT